MHTQSQTHTHHDKVITVSAPPYYTEGADD